MQGPRASSSTSRFKNQLDTSCSCLYTTPLSSRTTNLNRCLLLCSGAAPLLAAAPRPVPCLPSPQAASPGSAWLHPLARIAAAAPRPALTPCRVEWFGEISGAPPHDPSLFLPIYLCTFYNLVLPRLHNYTHSLIHIHQHSAYGKDSKSQVHSKSCLNGS